MAEEKIGDIVLSMIDIKRMIDAGSVKKINYDTHSTAAKTLMAVYLSYKEAGFSNNQAFKMVLTILSSTYGLTSATKK